MAYKYSLYNIPSLQVSFAVQNTDFQILAYKNQTYFFKGERSTLARINFLYRL